jgi:5-methylcytosine-specific restriction endonuclease McrA
LLDYSKKWREDHPGYRQERRKREIEANPNADKERHKRAYADPEYQRKAIERAKKWRRDNPERYKKAMSDYHKKNKERMDARAAKWRKDNPERARAIIRTANNNRRARNLAVGEVSLADMREVLARRVCAVCKEIHPRMEVDHIIALSRGGTNHISNLQLLCQPCNRSKWSFDHTEWLQSRAKQL